jgi:hypothetical protein
MKDEHFAGLILKLRKKIKVKRRGKVKDGIWILQEKSPVHTS